MHEERGGLAGNASQDDGGRVRRRDRDLMDEMRRRSEVEHERRVIGEAIGVGDDEVLVALQLAGYKAETIVLLELAPLLQIAWADGAVSTAERDIILQIASRERVVPDSPAHIKLLVALERRPSNAFFATSLLAIQAMLADLEPRVHDVLRRRLVEHCTAVAIGSSGLLRCREISAEEAEVLDGITAALEQPAEARRRPRVSNGG